MGKLLEAKADVLARVLARAGDKLPVDQAARVQAFIRHYYERVAPEDLVSRDVVDVYGAALAHWQLAQNRQPASPKIRLFTPSSEQHGWQSSHTVVEIVVDDMPFLVDSVSMELSRHGCGIHRIIHPVFTCSRDDAGHLEHATAPVQPSIGDEGTCGDEAFIEVEIDRQTEPARLDELRTDLERILADVRAATGDRREMLERAIQVANALDETPPAIDADEVAEAQALLRWMSEGNFIFLGYRDYDLLEENGDDVLRSVPGSGLGILRQHSDEPVSRSFAKLPPEIRRRARQPNVLNLTRANSRSTVHRARHLDYVGVKWFDPDGHPLGERRFVGLYAAGVYQRSPFTIPVLRRKVSDLVDRAGLSVEGHSGKALLEVLETYPFDELVQISPEELQAIALDIVQIEERQRVRLFVRRDSFGRFLSCLVYLPRDRYNTTIRQRMQDILQAAFGGTSVDFSTRVAESVLVRLHFTVYTEPGHVPDYDVAEIETRLAEATRSWSDDLGDALVEQCGEEQGIGLFRRYGDAFPAGYREETTPAAAVADIRRVERLDPGGDLAMSLYRPLEAPDGSVRFKLFRSGAPIPLSDVLPVLENLGVRVIDERPYEVSPGKGPSHWIYDFGLTYAAHDLDTDRVRDLFQELFARVWRGEAENDSFNQLVLHAGLSWREVVVLRAYCRYLRQAGTTFSQAYMAETLAHHPHIARRLVDLFHARLDPALGGAGDARAARQADLEDEILVAIDEVVSLDDDRILRNFLHVTLATLRTNHYQSTDDGGPKAHLSFKLDPARVPDLPRPLPMFEIFVYSPRMEGVHLRGGKVARGGIRWSDRREDFRTEVLGLMKAQMVKNAVIVPVGAKGGFVVRQPPAGSDREAQQREVVACYRTLIQGMLDLTDNLVGADVVGPPDVVRYDGDDPYLVVAADKGTATFSDIANGISADYGFWLGDAFASGGSAGYDHKKMGITARGAWESVKRHFRELGLDTQTTGFTVAGIGDMSGDVFGNGMLQSPHLRLVAAFDHRHIFIDPDPDPEVSYGERQRLFALPRSSWADYQPELISNGGGVFARSAKSVTLSPEAQRVLGTGGATLTPDELVSRVLRAPVDLLWNGGIGTYVKASTETHADVGDKVNDAVRVDADELRCRVVGEGGNLGFTQRARIEYAREGGRINTDAIDNSAGVDCSDHEVNIKILLDAVVADGDVTLKQRDQLMVEMTDEVAALVLRDNYLQTQALSNACAQSASMVDVHARYLRVLEQSGRLDRRLEFLPDEEELDERQAAGRGLTAPEFAVLIAYRKITLQEELAASDLPEDPYLAPELERYFPRPIRERFGPQLRSHRLRREIIATTVANSVINRAGTSAVFRLAEETGADAADIARAHLAARQIFGLPEAWHAIEALDNRVAAEVQTAMVLEGRRLVERASRWLLRTRRRPLDIAAAVEQFSPAAAVVADRLVDLLVGGDRKALEATADRFVVAGVPHDLARRVAGFGPAFSSLDIAEVATAAGQPVVEVAAVYFALGDRLQVDWVRDHVAVLPRGDRWQALARSALRDDVYGVHRALTAEVVASTPADLDVDSRVEQWIVEHRAHVDHCEEVLGDIRDEGRHDLVTISVALREVRNLVQSGTAATATATATA